MNKHRKAMEEEKPQVPITPMLDLTFQLLFFFITLFDPSTGMHRVEGQMDLMLPVASKDKEKQADKPEDVKADLPSSKDDDELDIPSDLTVIVNTQLDGSNNGQIASLFVENRGPAVPVDYDVHLTDLIKYLKDQREKADDPDKATIRVQGDSKLHWEAMIQVMDACRKAGFKNVGFMQPPDYNLTNP
jgi:biopolymer transport protein ExbD